MGILPIIITACGAALISTAGSLIGQILSRRAEAKKAKSEDISGCILDIKEQLKSLTEATQLNMLDRIKYLGLSYINDGAVDFDDRRILNAMHEVYHNGLGGNGDLDIIMREVNILPLKN